MGLSEITGTCVQPRPGVWKRQHDHQSLEGLLKHRFLPPLLPPRSFLVSDSVGLR